MRRSVICFLISVLILSAGPPAFAEKWLFPRNTTYPFGLKPNDKTQAELNQDLERSFHLWRHKFLTQQGAPKQTWRIRRDAAYGDDTVSEGIGYGMLILALMESKTNHHRAEFDGLWRYRKQFLNKNGLMHWRIDARGRVIGRDAATDGEEDVAMALLLADRQWGSAGPIDYLSEAKRLIHRIMNHHVEQGERFILKPGDNWGGSDVTNPSFYAPAYWRIFQQVTGDPRWSRVLSAGYEVVEKVGSKFSTGLMPDWCDAEGNPTGILGHDYRYDAVRVHWRIGIDLLWNGPALAPSGKIVIDNVTGWVMKSTAARPAAIVDGYTLAGAPVGDSNDPSFIGAFAIAAQAAGHQEWLNLTYARLVASLDNPINHRYYQTSLGVLYLLTLTGNWPRPDFNHLS